MKFSLRQRIFQLLCGLSLALAAGCAPAAVQEVSTPTPIPTPIIPTKPTYVVQKGSVIRQIEFSARLNAVTERDLYFQTGGRVQSVFVRKGDEVTEGQVLAQLISGTSNIDVRRSEIYLENAKLGLEMFLVDANRLSKDFPLQLQMRENEVELAQLALDEVNAVLDTTQVKAPFDGTVLAVYTSPDVSVEAYKTVMVIADLSKLEVMAEPASADLNQLQEGMPVKVVASSGPNKYMNGSIRRLPYPYGSAGLATEGDEASDTSTRISLEGDPADNNMKLGDMVRVQVILEEKDAALWLPPQAIRRYEGRRFVVVQDEGGPRRVDVTLGITSSDRVEIVDGLEEGQTVVAP